MNRYVMSFVAISAIILVTASSVYAGVAEFFLGSEFGFRGIYQVDGNTGANLSILSSQDFRV